MIESPEPIEFIANEDGSGEEKFGRIEDCEVYVEQELIGILDLDDNDLEEALRSLLILNHYNFVGFTEPFNS